MAKKKNKKNQNSEADCDEYDIETSSLCSSESSCSYNTLELDEGEIISQIENITVELMNPRPDTRITALKSLLKCFQNVYLDLQAEVTVVDSIRLGLESIFKKGTGVEKVSACHLIAAITVQLSSSQTESWFRNFFQLLEQYINDKTMNPHIRGAACVALSVLIWQCPGELESNHAKQIMNSLFGIFRGACLKGDGRSPVHEESVCDMQADAIFSWIRVLLSICSSTATEIAEAMIVNFVSILQNVKVDLRIASAEALAIVFEHIRDEKNERYTGPYYRQILCHLDELISDSSKAVSKKDRKKQRISLRPIFNSIRTQNHPEVQIKFGTEQVLLDTCAQNFFYETLCNILAHGVNKHLQTNIYIRDMFDLGLPIKKVDLANQDRKESKAQRQFMNQAISKNRDQARNFNRNKKSDFQNHGLAD